MRPSLVEAASLAFAIVLGAGAAQGQEVDFDPIDTTQAIGIDGLVVDGTTYRVDFTEKIDPQRAYGDYPGFLDFNDQALAEEAHDAVDSALNEAAAASVGAEGSGGEPAYVVGYATDAPGPNQLTHLFSRLNGSWQRVGSGDTMPWRIGPPATKVFARFTDTNPVSVPDVVALAEADAVADIEAAGLVAVVDHQSSETVPVGMVSSQNPLGGTMVDVGSDVIIVVSTGPQQQQVSVPDVVALPEANAVADIEAAGLVAVVDERSSETVPTGTVIGQNPLAGTMVDVGSNVTIVVSTGMAPEPTVNFDPMDPTKATGIDNLEFGGMTYNAVFTTSTTADAVYGAFPGSFNLDFASAQAANDAVNVALNAAGAATVGAEELQVGADFYAVAYASFQVGNAEIAAAWASDFLSSEWERQVDGDFPPYNVEEGVWATFTPVPEPGMALSLVAALATLGVVGRRRGKESEGTA